MGLTAEECCNTIGCNCAGTVTAETIGKIPIWVWPLIVIVGALILTVVVLSLNKNRVEFK